MKAETEPASTVTQGCQRLERREKRERATDLKRQGKIVHRLVKLNAICCIYQSACQSGSQRP